MFVRNLIVEMETESASGQDTKGASRGGQWSLTPIEHITDAVVVLVDGRVHVNKVRSLLHSQIVLLLQLDAHHLLHSV